MKNLVILSAAGLLATPSPKLGKLPVIYESAGDGKVGATGAKWSASAAAAPVSLTVGNQMIEKDSGRTDNLIFFLNKIEYLIRGVVPESIALRNVLP